MRIHLFKRVNENLIELIIFNILPYQVVVMHQILVEILLQLEEWGLFQVIS